jgi:hypothetical protein
VTVCPAWHRLKIHPLPRVSSILTIFVVVYGNAPNPGRMLEHTEHVFVKAFELYDWSFII